MLELALSIESVATRAGASFSPSKLFTGGVAGAWYDPSDKTTLFQSGTRASPGAAVVNAGDPVGLMLDKSGNNIDLTQATAGSRPTYQVDGSGNSYLLFDGVAMFLSIASGVTLPLPFDRITALQQVSWTLSHIIWAVAGAVARLQQTPTTPQVTLTDGSSTNPLANGAAAVGANAVIVERHVANASLLGVNNGALVGPVDVGALALSNSPLALGATTTGTFPANTRFYGAILIPQLSAANLASAKTYLGAKCGLSL
jgi:hypothetical protein